MSLETLMNISTALKLSTDYILFGNQQGEVIPLHKQLNEMDEERRLRAESAFRMLLPYIK